MTLDPGSTLPARPSPGAAGARLGELYSGNARMIYGLCRMLLNDPTEAEDATQQVFLSAYRSLLTGTEVEKPSAWLGTIARNECQARSVSRARNLALLTDAVTLVSPGADEEAVGRADAAELYSEVAALPDKQRAAVVLRDIYGLRYDEVASALGTSRPAVEALLFRGRRRLKHRLRPGLAAGVLVVPLSLHESLAYAVPGFVTAAGPVGAAAGVMAMPLLAKVAAVGAAATLAGSTGVIAERYVHDSPARPFDATVSHVAPAEPAAASERVTDTHSLVGGDTPLLDARIDGTESGPSDREHDASDGGPNDAKAHEIAGESKDSTEHVDLTANAAEHADAAEHGNQAEHADVHVTSTGTVAQDSGSSHDQQDSQDPHPSEDSGGDSVPSPGEG